MNWFRSIFSRIFKAPVRRSSTKPGSRGATSPTLPLLRAPVCPEWQEIDVMRLREFIGGETGQKLFMRARALEAAQAIKACNEIFHTEKEAMRAAGFGDCLNWLERLASPQMISQSTGAQVEPGSSGSHNSTDRQQTEAELVGKLSA